MIVIQIAGRLGRDAESRFTPSGQKLTTLTLATNIRKSGKDETVWWRVVIWGERFDKLLPYLKKGSAIIVVGEMNKPDIYTDKEGRPQVSLEITAEIIRFSPFNSNERNTTEGGQTASQPGSGNFSDGVDHGSPMQGVESYSSPSGYGAKSGAQRHSQPMDIDEPLPF